MSCRADGSRYRRIHELDSACFERGVSYHLANTKEPYDAFLASYLEKGRATALRRIALPGALWILGGIALASRRRRFTLLALAVASELAAFGLGYLPAVPRSRVPATPFLPASKSATAIFFWQERIFSFCAALALGWRRFS